MGDPSRIKPPDALRPGRAPSETSEIEHIRRHRATETRWQAADRSFAVVHSRPKGNPMNLTTRSDAIAMLKADHRKVEDLFEKTLPTTRSLAGHKLQQGHVVVVCA
jgi:hypothetical protein